MKNAASLLAGLLVVTAPLAFADRNETKDDKDFDKDLAAAVKEADAKFAPELDAIMAEVKAVAASQEAPGAGERRILKIVLDKSVPNSKIVAAIPTAEETFNRTYADFPECAEKWYMKGSFVTRAWVDAGGSPATLPVIDPAIGYKNRQMEDALRYWLSRDTAIMPGELGKTVPIQMTLEFQLNENENRLAVLEDKAKQEGWRQQIDDSYDNHGYPKEAMEGMAQLELFQKEHKRLQDSLDRYIQFRSDEKDWEAAHPGVHQSR